MLQDTRLDSAASWHGGLSVIWWTEGARPKRQLAVEWVEHAIPPSPGVGARRRGYGRTLIEEALPYSLGAETRFVLDNDTLFCRISLPLTTNDT